MEVYKVKEIINKSAISDNDFICKMAEAMKEKFDKYWGEVPSAYGHCCSARSQVENVVH